MSRVAAAIAALAVAGALAGGAATAGACVGRTLYVGYFETPDQRLVANMLAVFIDERTGTTVKLTRFGSREEAFDALTRDRISIYSDYSGAILQRLGAPAAAARDRSLSGLKEMLNARHNVIWLESFGYSRHFPERGTDARDGGPAGVMLCKDALAKFPALPRLLGKLRGLLDDDTMAQLLREAETSDPKTVARRFLKSKKLV